MADRHFAGYFDHHGRTQWLGIGSLGPPDMDYLRQVKTLSDAFEPTWLSDHVCWTRQGGRSSRTSGTPVEPDVST